MSRGFRTTAGLPWTGSSLMAFKLAYKTLCCCCCCWGGIQANMCGLSQEKLDRWEWKEFRCTQSRNGRRSDGEKKTQSGEDDFFIIHFCWGVTSEWYLTLEQFLGLCFPLTSCDLFLVSSSNVRSDHHQSEEFQVQLFNSVRKMTIILLVSSCNTWRWFSLHSQF